MSHTQHWIYIMKRWRLENVRTVELWTAKPLKYSERTERSVVSAMHFSCCMIKSLRCIRDAILLRLMRRTRRENLMNWPHSTILNFRLKIYFSGCMWRFVKLATPFYSRPMKICVFLLYCFYNSSRMDDCNSSLPHEWCHVLNIRDEANCCIYFFLSSCSDVENVFAMTYDVFYSRLFARWRKFDTVLKYFVRFSSPEEEHEISTHGENGV